jgi:2-amino-4-hydroxy-6-hydroxymethyldihydropteridine diphosphokinase
MIGHKDRYENGFGVASAARSGDNWAMARAWLALGSNLGDRASLLDQARARIADLPRTTLTDASRDVETDPVGGPPDQQPYLNAAVGIDTDLSPRELMEHLAEIELAIGRLPRTQREHWGPRPIDIDLLLYDQRIIDEPGLTVPHPRMTGRWFVLKPLADIAAEVTHPVAGRTIAELLETVESQTGVRAS